MNELIYWPWSKRSAWLVGTVESISSAPAAGHPESTTTTALISVEGQHGLGDTVPAGQLAEVRVSTCRPPLPLDCVGSRIEFSLGTWTTSKSRQRWRPVLWEFV